MIAIRPDEVRSGLADHGYLADEALATAVFLALRLDRPLLLEGEAGVGKTEVAKAIARWSGVELIRLQCYEGIDVSQAVYEWDYARQLLHLRAAELRGQGPEIADAAEDELFSERFLVRRPLLEAIAGSPSGPGSSTEGARQVLLVDEIDRADDEFEAFLLEMLSEYAITVPEIGTFRAAIPPVVIMTSNRTREVHDALKRRCLYHWLEPPEHDREVAIVRLHVPEVSESLAAQVATGVGHLRGLDLYKPPGVAESIDWAKALVALGFDRLDPAAIGLTLGSVCKYREDADRVLAGTAELVDALGTHDR